MCTSGEEEERYFCRREAIAARVAVTFFVFKWPVAYLRLVSWGLMEEGERGRTHSAHR
jgi:hypothetical protein